MIIPSKYSGYQAGIRLYPGGGGGGAPAETAPSAPPPPPDRMTSAAPPPMFQTYGSGDRTGSLVQAGGGMRPSQSDYSRPIYDPNYADNITGYQQSSQFYQPIYNSQYQNYARPATQFDASTYGTQPVQSPASASGMSRGNINNAIGNYFQQNPNSAMSDTLNAMRNSGINRTDIQQWGGVNNYGPQASAYQQKSFNPYTNSSGYGGFGSFSGPMGNIGNVLSQVMSQTQNPFSPQQPNYQPQMQTPFSYQQPQQLQPQPQQPPVSQPSYQPNYQPSPLPSYVYDTIKDLDQYKSQPVPQRMSSGPSQAIVGRSSQMRGTPNVMRRAEGGIASLMDDVE